MGDHTYEPFNDVQIEFEARGIITPATVDAVLSRGDAIHLSVLREFPSSLALARAVAELKGEGDIHITCLLPIAKQKEVHLRKYYYCFFPNSIIQYGNSLEILDLSYNHIKVVPTAISQLVSLRSLDLSHNLIDTLPLEMGQLQLTTLKLTKNPLSTLPEFIRCQKASVVLSFLRQLKVSTQNWHYAKLLILGEARVGKTSLLHSLIYGKTAVPVTLTEGIKVHPMNIPGFNVNAWDFGGQEVFYSTHQYFLSDKAVYMVVFNMTNPDCLRTIEYWLHHIKSLIPANLQGVSPPVFIVGTHKDTLSSSCFAEVKAQVDAILIKKLHHLCDIRGVCYVSNITYHGIKLLKKMITEDICTLDMFKQLVPGSFMVLERKIEQMRSIHPTLTWEEFKQVALEYYIEPSQLPLVIQFYHEAGIILHFNTNLLKDLVILDPQWIADVMSSIVTFSHTRIQNGIIDESEICYLWKHYPPEIHPFLVDILEKFEIVYKFPIDSPLDGKYLIPCMLPIHPAPETMLFLHKEFPSIQSLFGDLTASKSIYYMCERIYECEVIPAGCFGRFLLRLLHMQFSKVCAFYSIEHYWLDGFIAQSDTQIVLVQHNSNKISIQMRSILRGIKRAIFASSISDLFNTIILTLDELLENYPSLFCKRLIPCNHCFIKFPNIDPHMFNLTACYNEISMGRFYVHCRDSPNLPVRVDYLAPDLTPLLPFVINEPIKILGEFCENGKTYQYGKASFANVIVLEIPRRKCNPYISFVLSGLKHPNLVEFYGIIETPNHNSILSSKINKQLPQLYFNNGSSDGDYEENEQDKFMDRNQESFTEFILALGQRVSLKRGITQTMKNLVNSIGNTSNNTMENISRRTGFLHSVSSTNVFNDTDTIKLVLENLPNVCTLYSYLHSPENELIDNMFKIQICLDIAKGLKYLHDCTPPIVHGILNSNTVFLTKAPVTNNIIAKLSDFGIYTSVDVSDSTFAWFAPELLCDRERKPTLASDVYSFGILVYEIFTEKLPYAEFIGSTWEDVIKCILNENMRPDCYNLPHNISFLVQECWLCDPTSRPTSEYLVVKLSQMLSCTNSTEYSQISRINKIISRNMIQFSDTGLSLDVKEATHVNIPCSLEINCMLLNGNSVWVAGSGLYLFDAQACILRKILVQSQIKTYKLIITKTLMIQTLENCQIFAWNIQELQQKEIPNEHTGAIKSALNVEMGGLKTVWTGDTNGHIIIWSDVMEQITSFDVSGPVLCMTQHKEWVWIGMNKLICALQISDTNQRVIWQAHNAIVNDITSVLGQHEVWSCSNDGSICVWSESINQFIAKQNIEVNPLYKLEGHLSKVVSIKQISDNHVWSSGFEDTILIWDTKTHSCVSKVKTPHNDMIRCMLKVKDKVWSGSYDKSTPLCICEL